VARRAIAAHTGNDGQVLPIGKFEDLFAEVKGRYLDW
jgi:hypothetical protein